MNENIKQLILKETEKLIEQAKDSTKELKAFAIAEVWKILQLLTATMVQIIEHLGKELSSPEKKQIAIETIEKFYDAIFIAVDLPFLPSIVENMLHSYIKKILMILVDSAIDAMVTTFRDTGIFIKSNTSVSISNTSNNIADKFLQHLNIIVRK